MTRGNDACGVAAAVDLALGRVMGSSASADTKIGSMKRFRMKFIYEQSLRSSVLAWRRFPALRAKWRC